MIQKELGEVQKQICWLVYVEYVSFAFHHCKRLPTLVVALHANVDPAL